ncbi:FKBP-type peptidyl-prolyl cis-trans isomerase [Anaeromyxobacter dehalogenans]|uniref:Peptidyl-prolyl cis-trans isomerase n=1 Tax=Anaeromyxobacter dehalogenans (strain 2CP-C) TaxID=290397 RepID=Q2IQA9_ANADE|nr:peptidylprolyl isomerase [Anaeromyxobacter dehalogenans]ABC80994.1 response regulator receiver domain protein (CheY-like) [Anaeromyxobacter dehalogenans 2CP-C]
MKIAKGSVVGLDYSLHLGDGKVVDQSEPGEPLTYLHGEGQIVPGLESALEGVDVGESRTVVVAPADGYGEHDPRGVQEVPRKAFPPGFDPQVGMELTAEGADGEPVPFAIREVKPESVVIDLNHPLAGKTLHFDVKVRDVRAATAEELEHGHAHGPEGHGHEH